MVHLRFVVLAMRHREDWLAALSHATSLLKPGGHLQWTELDTIPAKRPYRGGPSTSGPPKALQAFQAQVRKYIPVQLSTAWDIVVEELEVRRFKDVWIDWVSAERRAEDRFAVTVLTVQAIMSVLKNVASSDVDGAWNNSEIAEMEQRAMLEARDGAYMKVDIWTVMGQKPS